MDENKKEKFKIEFDDDFDAWLENYEKAKKKEQYSQKPADVPVSQPEPVRPSAEKKAEPAPSERFKPVDSAAPSEIRVNRSNAVKNFKIQIDEEEYNTYIRKLQIQENLRKSINNNFEGFELYYHQSTEMARRKL